MTTPIGGGSKDLGKLTTRRARRRVGGDTSVGKPDESLDAMSKNELYDLAQELDVPGRSKISREIRRRRAGGAGNRKEGFLNAPAAPPRAVGAPPCERWALNVSVVDEIGRGLFHQVWERDARGLARPDVAIDSAAVAGDVPPARPVVAVAFAPAQGEYGESSRSEQVREVIEEWLAARGLPWFERHHGSVREASSSAAGAGGGAGPTGRRRGEHATARSRPGPQARQTGDLRGSRRGGAKVTAQARALGWSFVLPGEDLATEAMDAALDRCLSGELSR